MSYLFEGVDDQQHVFAHHAYIGLAGAVLRTHGVGIQLSADLDPGLLGDLPDLLGINGGLNENGRRPGFLY